MTASEKPNSGSDPAGIREWTDKTGRYKIQAELIDVSDDVAKLKRDDGKLIQIPISKLSDEDATIAKNFAPPEDSPFEVIEE
ncbi:MAG: hypothetical protein HKN47_23910 [Pirellulaceae bacterium]|nr:hypothetical protein [Pirellulaceae bacterium]